MWRSRLVGAMVGVAAVLALGCSAEESATDPVDEVMESAQSADIAYPNSFCEEDSCAFGGCRSTSAASGDLPVCNAWQTSGTFSLHAVVVRSAADIDADPEVQPGRPMQDLPPAGEICPGVMRSPEGLDSHCCQRVSNLDVAQPAFKLTSMSLETPVNFAVGAVSSVNRQGIEDDRYNWVMRFDTNQAGDIVMNSGLGLPNTDGSFTLANGAFESGGVTFNEDGLWNANPIPGSLEQLDDGRWSLEAPQYMERGARIPMFADENLDFVMMALPMVGSEMEVVLDQEMTCAGLRGPGGFEAVGRLSAYMLLDQVRDAEIKLGKGAGGNNLCNMVAGVKSCEGDTAAWEAAGN